MTQHLITTTMEPDRVVSVNDQELRDLERMGVVCARVPTDLSQVPAPTPLILGTARQEVTTDGNGKEEDQSETDGGQAPKAQEQRLRTTG